MMRNEQIHPSQAELALYAVASGKPDPRVDHDAVRHHLDRGCGECAAAVRRLQEAARETPFPSGTEQRRRDWILPRRIAMATAGVRGAAAMAEQQLFCTAGRYELNLLVEGGDPGGSLAVSGQILRHGGQGGPVVGTPVQLVDADTLALVDNAESSRFGEFDLFADPKRAYGLRIGRGLETRYVLVWEPESAVRCQAQNNE